MTETFAEKQVSSSASLHNLHRVTVRIKLKMHVF